VRKTLVHLVDDDAVVRGTLARLLASGGYGVREYASGSELLQSAETLDAGCILLDIDMPEADGFAVHRALTERSIDLPVIMMTGSGDLTVLALKAGAAEFMQKPFGRCELLSVIDQLCDHQLARAQNAHHV
jgi:two-component system, LuxR family, response regulator FixJ